MIYPDNFEKKIGFNEIRTQLKGRCMSILGTEWVDNKMIFSKNYDEICKNLALVEEFTRFMNEEDGIYEENFYDVRQALLRIRPERTYMEELELFDLKRSLKTILDLTQFFCRRENTDKKNEDFDDEIEENQQEDINTPYPTLYNLSKEVPVFPDVIHQIDKVLNKYGKIKDTASPELLSIRHSIEVTSRSISHTLRSIITEAQIQGYIDRDVSPTLRDGRLVVPVAPALKRKIKGIIHDESATGKTVFIEPAGVVEANNHIRELKAAERREIIRILQEISTLIRPLVGEMICSQQYLANIDYIRAASIWCKENACVVPQVVKYPFIAWRNAIHPLLKQSLEKHRKQIVPLNISLRNGHKILLISGPNAGGKSVCLKTIGLLQYMLQCGLPIPIQVDSTIGIFNDIFLDIGDEQSIEDDLSTYSGHLVNMKQMMKLCGNRSLLLIDEFGGGTEPQIGGALAEAILNHFVHDGAYGVITTHYQNLKTFAQKQYSVVNGAMLYDRHQMQPLYILQIGNPGSSFAIEIARKIGLPEDVIDYAANIVGNEYIMSDKYLQDIVRDKVYWENKRKNIHQKEKELDKSIANYQEEMQSFQREKKAVMAQAKEEAKILLEESNAKIENTIREIKEAQAEKERTQDARKKLNEFKERALESSEKDDEIARKIAKIQRRQQRKNNKKRGEVQKTSQNESNLPYNSLVKDEESYDSSIHTFQKGDFVRIKGQTTVGIIDEIGEKNAKVLFGVMYTTLPFKKLEPVSKPKEESTMKAATFVSKETTDAMREKKLNFHPEIDIRGMRVNDAMTAIAYFIDDAILCEQSQVRILHGTGTGALREITRQYLSTIDGVRKYHDEHIQFGGAGITVVKFK
jgi:DNA mismatch repair protein MutS2